MADGTGCRRYDPADDTTDDGDLAEARELIAAMLRIGTLPSVASGGRMAAHEVREKAAAFLIRTAPPADGRTREEIWRERCEHFDRIAGRGDR